MAEKWDKQLMDFLKRSGEELKTEAQRLMVEVKDPAKQAKVREGLENLRTWAVTTGKQAAERLESAVRQVEETVEGAFKAQSDSAPGPRPSPEPSPRQERSPRQESSPRQEPSPRSERPQAAKKASTKSIGPKKTATKAPAQKTAAKKAAAKTGTEKSIGRKKPSRPAT